MARRVRPVVVLGDPAAADHELTGLADPGFGAVVADQHDLLAGHRRAARARLAQLVLGPKHGVDPRLGCAVELPQHLAEDGLGPLLQHVGTGSSAEDDRAQRRRIAWIPLLRVDDPLEERRRHE